MNEADLDHGYTALCNALGEVGPERSELLLAMVALGLMARAGDANEVLALVAKARDRCLEDATANAGDISRTGAGAAR